MPVSNGLLTIEKVLDDRVYPRSYVFSLANSIELGVLSCAITSPTAGASVTQGTPVTITGTVSVPSNVAVKLGGVTLGAATMAGFNWSYSWTPQVGDIGAQTLNATATATVGGGTANAPGVGVTVAAFGFSGDFAALAVSFGLTVEWDYDPTQGTSGTTGTGISGWTPRAGTAGAMTAGSGATNGIGTITAGLGGKAGISGNGLTQGGTFTSSSPVTPFATNQHHWAVGRFLAYGSSDYLWCDGALGQACYMASANCNIQQYNQGSVGAVTTGVDLNQWYRIRASWCGAASTDLLRVGAHAPATSSVFNNAAPTATQTLFDAGVGGARSNWEALRYMKLRGPVANFLLFDADAAVKAQSYWTSAIEI